MNNALIPIQQTVVNSTQIQTVNARELHTFLEVGKDFTTWIKDRIESFDFVENQDFVCSPILGNKGRGGHNRTDYHLTLDMGKELSMVERNAKGKLARQYFIECERIAKTPVDPYAMLNDPAAMRGALLTYVEKVIALEAKVTERDNLLDTIRPKMIELVENVSERDKLIAIAAPKAAAHDLVTISEGSMCISNLSKVLEFQRIKDCFAWLHSIHYIFRRNSDWVAHQDKVRDGLLEVKTFSYESTDGSKRTKEQTLATAKGMAKLSLLRQKQLTTSTAAVAGGVK